jgi:predicted nucleic acid-binding protein
LDSSVWIEILSGGALAKQCTKEMNAAAQVFVPALVIFEVYRKIAQSVSEDRALSAIALLSQNEVVDLSRDIALTAADLSIEHKLAMADSVVLAHTRQANAVLLTLDNDFSGIAGTRVLRP